MRKQTPSITPVTGLPAGVKAIALRNLQPIFDC